MAEAFMTMNLLGHKVVISEPYTLESAALALSNYHQVMNSNPSPACTTQDAPQVFTHWRVANIKSAAKRGVVIPKYTTYVALFGSRVITRVSGYLVDVLGLKPITKIKKKPALPLAVEYYARQVCIPTFEDLSPDAALDAIPGNLHYYGALEETKKIMNNLEKPFTEVLTAPIEALLVPEEPEEEETESFVLPELTTPIQYQVVDKVSKGRYYTPASRWLASLRKARGITQTQMADFFGFTDEHRGSAYGLYEFGHGSQHAPSKLKKEHVPILSKAFDLPEEYISASLGFTLTAKDQAARIEAYQAYRAKNKLGVTEIQPAPQKTSKEVCVPIMLPAPIKPSSAQELGQRLIAEIENLQQENSTLKSNLTAATQEAEKTAELLTRAVLDTCDLTGNTLSSDKVMALTTQAKIEVLQAALTEHKRALQAAFACCVRGENNVQA